MGNLVLLVLFTVQITLAGQCHTFLDIQQVISTLSFALYLIQGCICPLEQQIVIRHRAVCHRRAQATGNVQPCLVIIITVRHAAVQLF